jgi:hypothetical protein
MPLPKASLVLAGGKKEEGEDAGTPKLLAAAALRRMH